MGKTLKKRGNRTEVLKKLCLMNSTIKRSTMLPVETLQKLAGEPDSGIEKEKKVVHVALHPKYVHSIPLGLVNHFNKIINQWHPQLNGILAGYGKLQLKKPTGQLINEEAHVHLDVQSEFWLFRPSIGRQLKGTVVKKSPGHVSCLVHGLFNVPCHRPQDIPKGGKWWASSLKLDSVVHLTVLKTDMSQKVPFILGDLPKPSNTKISLNESVPNPVEEMDTDDWDQATVTKEPENEDFIPSPLASPVQSPKKLSFQISPEKTSDAIDEQKDAFISSAIKVPKTPKKTKKETPKRGKNDSISESLESFGVREKVSEIVTSLESPKKSSKKSPHKSPKSAKSEEMDESETRDSLIASVILTPGSSKKAKKAKKSKKDQEELSLTSSSLNESNTKKNSKNKKAEVLENSIIPDASIEEAQELLLNSVSKKKSKKKKKDKVEQNGGMIEDEPNEIPALPDSGSRSPVRYITDSDSAIHSEEDTSKSSKKRKNTEMDDSIASPSKKKQKSNVSFETSTPMSTPVVTQESEKSSSKKKKKKDKEKEKPTTAEDLRNSLLSSLMSKSKPKKKSK